MAPGAEVVDPGRRALPCPQPGVDAPGHLGRPRQSGIGVLYLAPNLEWTPRATWVDHANRASASRYTLLGLRIGGNPTPEWSWFIDGRNLTGRSYIATTGVVDDSGGVDGAWYLPGDGRAVYLGLAWRPQRVCASGVIRRPLRGCSKPCGPERAQ